MAGCNDFRCKKCGTKISWFGEIKNAPPCSKCGARIPQEELEYLQYVIDVIAANPEAKVASFEEWQVPTTEPLSEEEKPVVPDLTPEESDADETYHLECCVCGARDQCSPEEANEKGWRYDEEAGWPMCPDCAAQ